MKWVTRIMVVLMLGAAACGGPGVVDDAGSSPDGGPLAQDSGAFAVDAGGTTDGGSSAFDAGTADAGTADAGTAGRRYGRRRYGDAGTADAGTADAGTADAGTADAGTADAGRRRRNASRLACLLDSGHLRRRPPARRWGRIWVAWGRRALRRAAASARLPGTFRAWLSVPGVDAEFDCRPMAARGTSFSPTAARPRHFSRPRIGHHSRGAAQRTSSANSRRALTRGRGRSTPVPPARTPVPGSKPTRGHRRHGRLELLDAALGELDRHDRSRPPAGPRVLPSFRRAPSTGSAFARQTRLRDVDDLPR